MTDINKTIDDAATSVKQALTWYQRHQTLLMLIALVVGSLLGQLTHLI
jgi:hypothetical protein